MSFPLRIDDSKKLPLLNCFSTTSPWEVKFHRGLLIKKIGIFQSPFLRFQLVRIYPKMKITKNLPKHLKGLIQGLV